MLEAIGSLPDAWLTELAHGSWWLGHRERATCSETSKTWEKTRLAASHSYSYRSPLNTCQVGPRQVPNIQSAGRHRAKSESHYRACSPLFKNTCKTAYPL